MQGKIVLLALASAFAITASAQDQVIQFDNVTPPKTVRLQANSTVSITVAGNLTAKCLNVDSDSANCDDIGTGGSAGAPVVPDLTGTNFAPAADRPTTYAAGTTFTLVPPTVTNAETCLRLFEGGTSTGWANNTAAPIPVPSAVVTLSQPNQNYDFRLRCFGAGGASTSNLYRVVTDERTVGDPPPGGDQCVAGTVTPPSGYTRNMLSTSFQQLVNAAGNACGEFPELTASVCRMVTSRSQYTSIRFTVPSASRFDTLAKAISWDENQFDGSAITSRVYMTFSQCPGDFRIPTSVTASTDDPTLSLACRSFRNSPPTIAGSFRDLKYNVNADGLPTNLGGEMRCGLKPGNTYYMNFILANPEGGIVPGEHNCNPSSLESCGVQMTSF